MRRVVYQSRASRPLDEGELSEMLAGSRRSNEAANITGMLLHQDGCFLQAIEGDDAAIDTLWSKIRADSRHTDIDVLADQTISHRRFSEWTIGARNISPGQIRQLLTLADVAAEQPLLIVSKAIDPGSLRQPPNRPSHPSQN